MGDLSRLQRFASERRQSLLNALAYMKDITLLTDVTLICNGKPHPAHRVMLAASSCYFRDIFQNKKKVSRINVHDVDEVTFEAVLKFLYTSALTLKDVEGLKLAKVLSAFRGLNVHCLDNITSCALSQVMDTNNFYAMWEMVKELQLKEAEAIVVKYVASNLKECCHTQLFPLLTLQQMISVMSSKHLVSGNSNTVLEAVALWGSYDQERRAKYLTSLLSIIGLTVDPKLRQELLSYEGNRESLTKAAIKPSCESQVQITTSLTYRPQSTSSSVNCKLQTPVEVVKSLEPSDTNNSGSSSAVPVNFTNELQHESQTVDLKRIQARSRPNRSAAVAAPAPAPAMDEIEVQQSNKYIRKHMGREKPMVLTDLNQNFNRETDFTPSAPVSSHKPAQNNLGQARKSVISFSPSKSDTDNNSQMLSTSRKIDSVEKSLDLSSKNSSETVKVESNSFLAAKLELEKASSGNEYILITATTRYGITVQQSYATGVRQWLPMKRSLTLPLDAASNFYFNRCIFIVGGETIQGNKLNTAYAFNLEEQNIKKLSPMSVARSETGMTQLSGSIYAIGGRGDDNKPLSHVEYYLPAKDQWQSIAGLRKARIQPNVATADGVIYVVGGCSGDEFRINTTCEYFDNGANQWTEMCPISRLHADSLLLIANHQERIYALQCQKPDKLFFYLPRQNKWVHMETNPRVTKVTSFFSCSKALWVADRNGKILKYDDTSNVWQLETKLLPDLVWPVSVYVVDFADG